MEDLDFVRLYAKSWNQLNFEVIEPFLSSDVVYDSQVVLESLVGKAAVSDYLEGKMETIKRNLLTSEVYAEVGYCGSQAGRRVQLFGAEGRPCVLMAQGDISIPTAIVLLETDGRMIKQVSIGTVVPDPASAIRTGEYPE